MDTRMAGFKCAMCGAPESSGTILTGYVPKGGHHILLCELCYVKWRKDEYERQNVWSVISETPGDNKSGCIR